MVACRQRRGDTGYAIDPATNSIASPSGGGTSNAEIGEASSSGLSRPRVARQYLGASYWRITRARLDSAELDREVGWLAVPELPQPTMLPSDALAAPPLPAT